MLRAAHQWLAAGSEAAAAGVLRWDAAAAGFALDGLAAAAESGPPATALALALPRGEARCMGELVIRAPPPPPRPPVPASLPSVYEDPYRVY